MDREVYRGDDYPVYRALFRYELVTNEIDPDTLLPIPFNMAKSTIRTTFKTITTSHAQDPEDVTGYILAEIVFDGTGKPVGTPAHFSLPTGVSAAAGILHLTVARTVTKDLPLGMVMNSDVQVTDALDNVSTMPALVTLVAIDGYTNRGE